MREKRGLKNLKKTQDKGQTTFLPKHKNSLFTAGLVGVEKDGLWEVEMDVCLRDVRFFRGLRVASVDLFWDQMGPSAYLRLWDLFGRKWGGELRNGFLCGKVAIVGTNLYKKNLFLAMVGTGMVISGGGCM